MAPGGQASAIALALQQRDAGLEDLLLIDDRCCRGEAPADRHWP
ncbi:hypothetical protein [Synechococcus sp. CB0101]|nr:hypothetical protein [Synechococcus sp. CB0101]